MEVFSLAHILWLTLRARGLYCSQPVGGSETKVLPTHSQHTYHSLRLGRRSAHAVGVVVEHSVLNHGGEDEQEADCDKKVHGRHVGHSGQGVPGHRAQGGHGQHRGDAWGR